MSNSSVNIIMLSKSDQTRRVDACCCKVRQPSDIGLINNAPEPRSQIALVIPRIAIKSTDRAGALGGEGIHYIELTEQRIHGSHKVKTMQKPRCHSTGTTKMPQDVKRSCGILNPSDISIPQLESCYTHG
ncbi:MAG TPA: hypothetical protein VN626_03485 [Clostridia bacterium]|nr:hypothetical protein [Clostridia bacterium]